MCSQEIEMLRSRAEPVFGGNQAKCNNDLCEVPLPAATARLAGAQHSIEISI